MKNFKFFTASMLLLYSSTILQLQLPLQSTKSYVNINKWKRHTTGRTSSKNRSANLTCLALTFQVTQQNCHPNTLIENELPNYSTKTLLHVDPFFLLLSISKKNFKKAKCIGKNNEKNPLFTPSLEGLHDAPCRIVECGL